MPSYTDIQLAEMEKELNKVYSQVQAELEDKWDKYMTKAQVKVDKLKNAYEHEVLFGTDTAKMTEAKQAYEKAMVNVTLKDEHYQAMVDQVTDKLADTNQIALNYLNDKMPGIYCHSYNEFGDKNIKGYSFELVNEDTVKNLVKNGNTSLLPQKALNIPKDKQWNTKNINSQILQGILQGESIPKMAKRLQNVTDMNHKSAVRNARTMTTGAENKGRQDSFTKATNDGVIMKRRWVATFGDRTRDWHADLNGVEVDIDQPWENDYGEIMYPGDPSAHPANVYNCRCSIRAIVKGFKPVEKPVALYAEQYQGVSVTAQYYSMLNEDKAIGNEFWKLLNAEGKPSQVWKDYLAGNASKDVATKLDNVLAKYKGTGQPIKPGKAKIPTPVVQKPKPDLGMYQDKSMTATFYSVKAEDSALGKEFWSILQAEANPSTVWSQYLIGTAPKDITDKLDKILLQHKGTGSWSKPVSAKAADKTVKVVKTAETVEDKALAKAKEKLAVAQGNLDSLGKKTYSGIWKDDVTLADYEIKKASIAAKKQYYYDQIEDFTHKIDAGDIAEALGNSKIAQFEKYIDDLVEFETKGKLYAEYSKEYTKAAKKVRDLTPVGETFGPGAYTQARKDAAVWAKSGKEADSVLRDTTGEVWRNAKSTEKNAIYDYTQSYHKFNEPLRGIEYGTNQFKGVGKTDLNAGYQSNGKKLNALTDILEKSHLPQDQWFQRGCNYSGMDKFFGCDPDLLRYGTQADLEKELLGKTVTEYGFMSMGSAKGQGFSGNILLNIYAPEGTKAMYVEPFSAFGNGSGKHWDGISKQGSFGSELETLLQQNTDFRITKINRNSSGTLYFDLEIIAQNEPQRWKP